MSQRCEWPGCGRIATYGYDDAPAFCWLHSGQAPRVLPEQTELERAMSWLDDHALSGVREAAFLADYVRRREGA